MSDRLVLIQDDSKITVERRRADGTLHGSSRSTFSIDHHYRKAAPLLSVSVRELQRVVDDFRRSGVSIVPLGEDTQNVFTTRAEHGSDRTEHADLQSALGGGALIEWTDSSACCALDLDFHGDSNDANRPANLTSLAQSILPRPIYWWITRNTGLRLIYTRQNQTAAIDLAGVAALTVLSRFPEGQIELLTRTRKPPGEYHACEPSDDRDALRKLFGAHEATDDDVTQYLDARGMVVGSRYPHAMCPVNPSDRAVNNAGPVQCHDDHIYCFICAADGVCFGSGVPGHFPYAKLCGTAISSLFRLCVMRFTHWCHAKFLLRDIIPNEPLAKIVYRAALNYIHGEDPRIPLVFTTGDGLARFEGHWGDESGVPLQFRGGGIPRVLCELPTCKYLTTDKVETSFATAEWLTHTGDLTRFGYPAISPVYGYHVAGLLDRPQYTVPVLLHNIKDVNRRPKYVNKRAGWGELERVFPGMNKQAIKLLIAAKGCIEHGAGIEPMLFFTGPTGASKTASVQISAAILGDAATTIPYASNDERLRASLLSAKKRGSFATFDEFLKGARRNRIDASAAMEVLLNFTRDSVSHVLYVGPVAIGALPVCVWCDTTVPREVQEHAQLARRLTHVYFPDRMKWEHTLRDSGVFRPEELRLRGGPEILEACDSVLSDVVDEFFTSGEPIFADIANALGFRQLEAADVMTEKHEAVRRLFALVGAAPVLSGRDRDRWPDAGWKLIDLVRDSELSELWRSFSDKEQTSSRSIDELDLRSVLSLATQAKLEVRAHGGKVVVRFSSLDGTIHNNELARKA